MPRNVLLLVLVAVVLLIGLWLLLGASRRRREVAPPDTSEFQRPSEAAGSLPPVPSWDSGSGMPSAPLPPAASVFDPGPIPPVGDIAEESSVEVAESGHAGLGGFGAAAGGLAGAAAVAASKLGGHSDEIAASVDEVSPDAVAESGWAPGEAEVAVPTLAEDEFVSDEDLVVDPGVGVIPEAADAAYAAGLAQEV
ncbi:MAG TPA: hypothetical protein PKC73_03005, partial [Dermatophilaceae bacterium]|nr:hypothetical protein [Dermatophilaceae bacterium]